MVDFRNLHRILLFTAMCLGPIPFAFGDSFPEPYNTEPGDPEPMPAEEAARTAKLPPGFRLEVFASEPEVQQPIAICFDGQKRLWVAECYTFAEQPRRWDLDLNDRIVVLDDTDGDGKSDSRTVFWDQGKRLTSIAHGEGGVWALCAPNLLFIPDGDGDLVPDGEPEVVLEGFDAENIGHNIVNGLKWGPDGWLYGRHGITSTSRVGTPDTPDSQRVSLNCSIWRYDPVSRAFEVFCHGGTNPWGMDWDANGQLFYTNTVIGHLWHAIPGGYYERMFGTHLNRHVYEIIEHTADHYHWDTGAEKWNDIRKGVTGNTSALGGGHAHMGCLIYQGGSWPEEYHGKLFTCNLHGRRVNMDILEREGCGYTAHHGKDFLFMEDPWFRGLDLITGPEGDVWINDWSDTGECHDNSGIHRTSGRIYRIVYEGADRGKPSVERPQWLTQRAENAIDLDSLFASGDEAKRAMAVRWLSEDAAGEDSTLERFEALAAEDSSGLVRLELAAALQRLSLEKRISLAAALSARKEDAADRQQPLMVWYGVSPAVPEFAEEAIDLAMKSEFSLLRRFIARRLTEDLEKRPEAVESLLSRMEAEPDGGKRQDLLGGMSDALEGWVRAEKPKNWDAFAGKMESGGNAAEKEMVRELAILFGDGRARDELLATAKNEEADPSSRRAALESLLRKPSDDLLPLLKEWANDKILGREAILGLANYDAPGVAARVINHWKRYQPNRAIAIDTLVSRASYAAELLDAVAKGDLPRDAITPFQARQIQSLGKEDLTKRLAEVWGDIADTPEEKQKEIEKWKLFLTPDVIGEANLEKGRAVFQQACGACHKLYGEGGALGPDLTGSDRQNLDYVLENVINPNAVVPADYRMTVFTLKDGRVISGVIPEQSERSVTVQTPVERMVVDRLQIEKSETLPMSLMPEGLLGALDEESVRDLVAYLTGARSGAAGD